MYLTRSSEAPPLPFLLADTRGNNQAAIRQAIIDARHLPHPLHSLHEKLVGSFRPIRVAISIFRLHHQNTRRQLCCGISHPTVDKPQLRTLLACQTSSVCQDGVLQGRGVLLHDRCCVVAIDGSTERVQYRNGRDGQCRQRRRRCIRRRKRRWRRLGGKSQRRRCRRRRGFLRGRGRRCMDIFHVPTHDHQCAEPHRQGDVCRPLSLVWHEVQLRAPHHQHEHEGSKNNTPPSDQKDRIEEALYENWYKHEHHLTLSSLSCIMNFH